MRFSRIRKVVGTIHGFDTEWNKHGNILCLSVSTQKSPNRPYSHKEMTFVGNDTYDYLKFLLEHGRHSAYNFFWNIDADFGAIMQEFLVTTRIDLDHFNYTYVNEKGEKVTLKDTVAVFKNGKDRLLVTYLQGKYFKIRDKHHTAYFWDAWQFYNKLSLDKAHSEYFGTGKSNYRLSNKDVGIGTDLLNMEMLFKRCELDAWFTRELGQKFLESALKVLGFLPAHLYSQASLSQAYFVNKVSSQFLKPFKDKDSPLTRKVILYALNAYKGGIFLVTTKGMCRDVTESDLVSAYPSAIHDLPDMVFGEWKEVNAPDKNARFGLYHVAVQFDGLMPMYSPSKSEGILYPKTVKLYEDYITAIEYWYFKEHGIDLIFIDGVEFHGRAKPIYPFAEAVDFCFEQKSNALNTEEERMLWKIVLNAMYGKMAQDDPYVGELFNPVYASYITARTRLKLRDMIPFYEEVYSFDTDGMKGRLKKGVKIPTSNRLGGIEIKKYWSHLCFVKSGIIANENEELIKCRGFGRDEEKKMYGIYWEKDCLLQYNPFHAFKLKECLQRKEIKGYDGRKVRLDASYINRMSGDVFPNPKNPAKSGFVKKFSYADAKRHWDFPWNEGKYGRDDLLSGPIKSKPLNDKDLAKRGLFPYKQVKGIIKEKKSK